MAASPRRASILRDAVLRTAPQDEVRMSHRLLRGLCPVMTRSSGSGVLVERSREQLAALAEVVQGGLQFAQLLARQPLQGWRPEAACGKRPCGGFYPLRRAQNRLGPAFGGRQIILGLGLAPQRRPQPPAPAD